MPSRSLWQRSAHPPGSVPASYWFWSELRVGWLKRALDDYNRERRPALAVS